MSSPALIEVVDDTNKMSFSVVTKFDQNLAFFFQLMQLTFDKLSVCYRISTLKLIRKLSRYGIGCN